MNAQEKKVYYNRVRRTCAKHDIDIEYDGVQKCYMGVDLIKDGKTLASHHADNYLPLDINWKRLHEDLTVQGLTGGIK